MRRLLSGILAILIILSSSTVVAQQNSLLWKVSGNGLSKPSYIFGTIHVVCSADYKMADKVSKAFNSSDQLVLEVDLSDPQELQQVQKLMRTEKSISSSLTPEEKQKLENSLMKYFNLKLKDVDNLSIAALESMMVLKAVECADKKMYEMELLSMAKQQGKQIGKLENITDQFSFFDKAYSPKDLVKHLEFVPEYSNIFTELVKNYKAENLTLLSEYANDSRFMSEDAKHWLLTARNENWVKMMPSMMSGSQVFFAVGAMHLPGENGVLELLKKAGYTVTPVYN
jgi:uncharacterized protein YbaP (TraB family)